MKSQELKLNEMTKLADENAANSKNDAESSHGQDVYISTNEENPQDVKPSWLQLKIRKVKRWFKRRKVQHTEDIIPYRRIALQIVHDRLPSPSLLVVSANREVTTAQSCVLLTMALASVAKRRILLVDICNAGSIIPNLLGCTSRAGESNKVDPQQRKQRFFENEQGWYFNTREGHVVGPFLGLEDAKLELEEYIENDLFEKTTYSVKSPSHLIMDTQAKNIDYLSAISAGLHGMLDALSEEQAVEEVTKLISEVKEGYDYVVFYGGYLLDCPSALKIAPHTGKVILTSIENNTSQSEYKECSKSLRLCGVSRFENMLIRVSGKALKIAKQT